MKRKILTQLPSAGSAAKSPAKPKQKLPGSTVPKVVVRKRIDWPSMVGHKFHFLTVIAFFGRNKCYQALLACRCECGNLGVFLHAHLQREATKSCGCLHSQLVTKHGHCTGGTSKLYRAHRNMFDRCFGKNPRHVQYRRKGIQVCRRWTEGESGLSAFECFVKDMGEAPSPLHTVERINNDDHYTPSNCRWATKIEQQNNTDLVVLVKAFGVSKSVPEWSRITGINKSALRHRLQIWTPEKALTEPVRLKTSRHAPNNSH